MSTHTHKFSKYSAGILQGAMQLQVGQPRKALAREYAFERKAFSMLSILLAVLILAYLYFVATTIFSVMTRAEAERKVRVIETNLASLEQQYLALSKSVSAQAAAAQGLSPIGTVSYVYRPGNTALAQPEESNL